MDKNIKKFGETFIKPQKPFKGKTRIECLEEELINAIRHQKKMNIELTQRIIKLETQLANQQTLIDDTRKSQHDLKESNNLINRKFKWIGENLIAE